MALLLRVAMRSSDLAPFGASRSMVKVDKTSISNDRPKVRSPPSGTGGYAHKRKALQFSRGHEERLPALRKETPSSLLGRFELRHDNRLVRRINDVAATILATSDIFSKRVLYRDSLHS